jgi:amino acid transporter
MEIVKAKELGLLELIAIALGGMIGGGIFTILGISVALIGNLTPIAIIIGGLIAALAAYSYVKLALYFKTEGASYTFFKHSFPNSGFAISAVGWYVIFGYISTLALYAYTFSSYALSGTDYSHSIWLRKVVAIAIIFIFALVNSWSVKGMGKLEDVMVYTKLLLLGIVSFVLITHGDGGFARFSEGIFADAEHANVLHVLIVASLTFVAYEGFQLVINAQNVMADPSKNIPRAIYAAIAIVIVIYVVIALGALFAIPAQDIINNKEFALASGAGKVLGGFGSGIVIASAVLATSSAISGTIFGASRQLSMIAADGNLPRTFTHRSNGIPVRAILLMASVASLLIVVGGLELILEFGSLTFLLVSLIMAYANFKLRKETGSSALLSALSIAGLAMGAMLVIYYELTTKPEQIIFILALYAVLTIAARFFAKRTSAPSTAN